MRLFWSNLGSFLGWINERNFIAAFFSLLAVVVLSGALAEEQWIYLAGGHCPINHLGASLFYARGQFEYWYTKNEVNSNKSNNDPPDTPAGLDLLFSTTPSTQRHVLYKIGRYTYVDCVTPKIVNLFHGLMVVCFLALACSLTALLVDIVGNRRPFLVCLQRTSIFSIFTVIVCVITIGLTCWIAILVEEQQRRSTDKPDDVQTAFEDGFYLVTSAAVLSICAVVANVVKSTLDLKKRLEDRQALIDSGRRNSESQHDLLLAAAAANPIYPLFASQADPDSNPAEHPFPLLFDVPPPPPYSP